MMNENKPKVMNQKEIPHLKRALGLWDLVFYGIVLITITAPLPIFGIISNEARGHVATDYFDSHGGNAFYCDQLWTYGECLSTGRFSFFLCRKVYQSVIGISYRMGNGYGLYA